jgi:hypothetical protein
MMKKYYISLIALIFALGLLNKPAYAQGRDIELLVKSAECLEDNKILIKYSVTNSRNFDRPNIVIGFKILENEKIVACKRLKITVPKNADGSEIYEATIDRPCKDRPFRLVANMFRNMKQFYIDEWFEGCPE